MMEGLSDLYHILLANYHISFENDMLARGGTRSEKWWGCAAGRWKLDPKRSREKWNLGPKISNSVWIGSFNTPKDRFGVGGWDKIPQKDRARSCQSEKRGSKPRHICITHHIGSTPPPPPGMLGAWHVIIVWEYPGLKVFECHGSTQSRKLQGFNFYQGIR